MGLRGVDVTGGSSGLRRSALTPAKLCDSLQLSTLGALRSAFNFQRKNNNTVLTVQLVVSIDCGAVGRKTDRFLFDFTREAYFCGDLLIHVGTFVLFSRFVLLKLLLLLILLMLLLLLASGFLLAIPTLRISRNRQSFIEVFVKVFLYSKQPINDNIPHHVQILLHLCTFFFVKQKSTPPPNGELTDDGDVERIHRIGVVTFRRRGRRFNVENFRFLRFSPSFLVDCVLFQTASSVFHRPNSPLPEFRTASLVSTQIYLHLLFFFPTCIYLLNHFFLLEINSPWRQNGYLRLGRKLV